MAKLIIPDKNKHKYVVGIDFGHGETSAAICELEWEKDAAHRLSDVDDIDMHSAARKKVIPSAICRVNDKLYLGEEAFEHTSDNKGIRISFKQRPESLEGEGEMLMRDYMEAVYRRILENDYRLTPDNHMVYIARPSGWTDEEAKELYRQMALNAGIPLAGLTSESRAAIFYAKSPKVEFANEISHGAIVFDLGSSTLDMTHLSDDDNPVDFGYNLGASIIDRVIYNKMILKSDAVQNFIKDYPEYKDALLFKARQFKESAYSRDKDSKTIGSFALESILTEGYPSFDQYADTQVSLRIPNLQALNDIVEETAEYQQNLRSALIDFKNNHLKNRKVNGVFLTGGASRMNFIIPLIAEVMELPIEKVKIDGDNPSLTISRGIALLGVTDAITSLLVKELKSSIPTLLDNESLFQKIVYLLSENLAQGAWNQVTITCNQWVQRGTGRDEEQLKKWLKRDLEEFQNTKLKTIIEDTVRTFFITEGKVIINKTNEIIRHYTTGREISTSGDVNVGDLSAIQDSIESMSDTISEICDSITNTLANVLWAALGIFLFGLFSVAYYVFKGIYNFFRSDESIREDKANKLLSKRHNVVSDVKNQLNSKLLNDMKFKKSLTTSLNDYFTNMLESNLQKVMIPIE